VVINRGQEEIGERRREREGERGEERRGYCFRVNPYDAIRQY
jgi:hypothetical protein